MTGRRVERFVARGVLAFLTVKLLGLAINLRAFPVLRRAVPPGATSPRAPGDGSGASILIPARDEEVNLPTTLPLVLAQGAAEVVVVDDQSTDTTASVVSGLAGQHRQLRLVSGQAMPTGWVGKTWACHQLSEAATGDLLVFCDADVYLADGALAAIEAEMVRQRADVFSVFPRQRTETLGERLTVPLIDDVLLCLLPFPLLEQPVPAAATANGQLLAFRRSAYERLGGHRAVRTSIVEDVRMAQQTRRAGLRLGLALGGDLVQVRMYRGFRAASAGIAKSLLAAHGGSRVALAVSALVHLTVYTLPWLRAGQPMWRVAAALGLLERIGVNAKTGRRAWVEALLTPATPVAAIPVYARAAGRSRTWKGRRYP